MKQVVRAQEYGLALILQAFQVIDDEERGKRVEPRVWLVQYEDSGVVQQRTGDSYLPPHAFRELSGELILFRKLERAEQRVYALLSFAFRHLIKFGEKHEILSYRHVLVKRALFRQVAYELFYIGTLFGHVPAHYLDLARRRTDEANYHFEDGGLSSTIVTYDPHDFAVLYLQIQISDGRELSI